MPSVDHVVRRHRWTSDPFCTLAGIEPHDWMWLATRELLLDGWSTQAYPRTHKGGTSYVLDPEAAWHFAINSYIQALGPKCDLTRYRSYMTAKEFKRCHWFGKGALNFTGAKQRDQFKRRGLAQQKELYSKENMHGLVLHADRTVFDSVKGQPPPPPLTLGMPHLSFAPNLVPLQVHVSGPMTMRATKRTRLQ